jgi:hypothetical protein
MGVGDLVKYWGPQGLPGIGIVVEAGVYVGRKNVLVLWCDGDIATASSIALEVINGNRNSDKK